jgi:hypothetical protein
VLFNVINFIDISSKSLLSIVDNDECHKRDGMIMVDKDFKDMFMFYADTHLKASHKFGNINIVINTCIPCCNWRRDERGEPIEGGRYKLTENGENIFDKVGRIDKLLDYAWQRISRSTICRSRFTFIQMPNMDTVDITMMLENIYGFKTKHSPYFYYLISDANMDYVHYPDIPEFLYTELGIELKKFKIEGV